MSNTIASQTWMMIEEVNWSQQSQQRAQKQGEARVAQQNSSLQTVSDMQQFEKDVVLPADPHARQAVVTINTRGISSDKLSLPNPIVNWNGLQGVGSQQQGLISIMGTVLCLQAKMNSNFWSTLWKQASASMMMEVKFAPIIGNAIQSAYGAQSKSTGSQADQSQTDGIISLSMFFIGIAMGAYADFKATPEENPLNTPKPKIGATVENAPKEAETKVAKSLTNSADSAEEDTQKLDNEVNQQTQKQDESYGSRAKKFGKSAKSLWTRSQKRLTTLLGKTAQYVQMMAIMSEGTTKLNDVKYQNAQASYQSTEGGAQALSKEAEQYAQFYGQDFSRQEDLRQGSGQNLDYAMNILKSAADGITQTVTAMFRG